MTYAEQVRSNAWRWILKSTNQTTVILLGLVTPLVPLVVFTVLFGNAVSPLVEGTYLAYLIPAMVIQTSLATAASSGINVVDDTETGMYEKIRVSATPVSAAFLGKTLTEILQTATKALWILVVGATLGVSLPAGFLGAAAAILVTIIFGTWFAAIANIVAITTQSKKATKMTMNFVQFPLFFFSSAFIPIEQLPATLQSLAAYNPVTLGIETTRYLLRTTTYIERPSTLQTIVPDITALIALSISFSALAIYVHITTNVSNVKNHD